MVVNIGVRPGGLAIRTIFQLWFSLALFNIHGTATLLIIAHVYGLQRKMNRAVKQLAGWRTESVAVLVELVTQGRGPRTIQYASHR